MKMRLFSGSILLLSIVALTTGCGESTIRPNIILITVDTLRPDHLGAYGYHQARTPTLDRLAEDGVRFAQATTTFPRTTPALASLHTGLWPQHHGSREAAQPFEAKATLAEVLGQHGYITLGVNSNRTSDVEQGFDRGFHRFAGSRGQPRIEAAQITDRALDLIREADRSGPVFLWVHYLDPHFPYQPPSSFDDQPEAPACREITEAVLRKELRPGHLEANRDGVAAHALRDCRLLYDAEIAYTDAQIGRLLEGLEIAGVLEPSIIVFTSDHGENMGEAGLYYEHGPSIHDAGLRIPLFIGGSYLDRGVNHDVVILEDIMPTLLALVGVREPPKTDGIDLSVILESSSRDGGLVDRMAPAESGSSLHIGNFDRVFSGRSQNYYCFNGERYSLCSFPERGLLLFEPGVDPHLTTDISERNPDEKRALMRVSLHWQPEEPRERAVRTPRYKLVEYPRLQGGHMRILVDLKNDPGETQDVSTEHPEIAARLGRFLESWSASIPSVGPHERSEEHLKALRSLGYIN